MKYLNVIYLVQSNGCRKLIKLKMISSFEFCVHRRQQERVLPEEQMDGCEHRLI